jgi:hypothetical protein
MPPSPEPEQWNTMIGPIVLVVFLVIVAIAYFWGRAGYPLP